MKNIKKEFYEILNNRSLEENNQDGIKDVDINNSNLIFKCGKNAEYQIALIFDTDNSISIEINGNKLNLSVGIEDDEDSDIYLERVLDAIAVEVNK